MSRTLFLLLLLLFPLRGFSQEKVPGTATDRQDMLAQAEQSQKEFLHGFYSLMIGTSHEVVNGSTYYPYHYRSKYKPLLFYGKERTASIIMNGRKFDNIILQYDTFTDEVVFSEIENAYNKSLYQISLNKDIIKSFSLFFKDDTLNFRNMASEEFPGRDLPAGFYEVAYDGPSKYIIRHRSVVHGRNGIDEYFYSPAGYVKIGKEYSKLRSNRQFIKSCGTRSLQMKEIIDRNNIKIGKADRNRIIGLLIKFDSL
jgi:hypothetical protein